MNCNPVIWDAVGTQMYPDRDLQEAKLSLLMDTKMIDYTNEVHQQVHGTQENLPGEIEKKK